MSEMMCCPLDSGEDDRPEFHTTKIVTGRKAYSCHECRDPIPVGTKHEYVSGKWDGDVSQFRNCLSCVEIRNHFACGGGFVYGEVWEDIRENFFPDMKAGGPCMEGLSPEAKNRLFTLRMEWLSEQDDE